MKLHFVLCLYLGFCFDIFVTKPQYSFVPSTLKTYSISNDYLSSDSGEYELHGWVKVLKTPANAAEFAGVETETK